MRPSLLDGPEVRTLSGVPGVCDDLKVIPRNGCIFSSWRPSPEEMSMLSQGATVWLVVRGEHHPVVTMIVGDRKQVIPPAPLPLPKQGPSVEAPPEPTLPAEQYNWLGRGIRSFAQFLLGL